MKDWRIERYTRFPPHSDANFTDWLDLYYRGRRVLHLEMYWTGVTLILLAVGGFAWWHA
jgi:hypothetical protein